MQSALIRFIECELRKSQGKKTTITRAIPVSGGCISHALELHAGTQRFFLKWKDSVPADLFIREAEALAEMSSAPNPWLVIPRVILAGGATELPGFLLLEYLEQGHSSLQEENLGRGLAQLHRRTADSYGFHHDNYCGSTPQHNPLCSNWIEFFTHHRLLHVCRLIENSRGLSLHERKLLDRFTALLPTLLNYPAIPSLIHGDLWSGNFLFTNRGPALIDPAAYYADREMELAIMTMFGGFPDRTWSAYQEHFPLEYGWADRNKIYQLYHILNHHYLFGGFYKQQAFQIMEYYCGR